MTEEEKKEIKPKVKVYEGVTFMQLVLRQEDQKM